MKSRQLIDALVADRTLAAAPARTLWRALLAPVLLATILLLCTAGVRADFTVVSATPRFLFKFLVAGSLVIAATGMVLRLARPGAESGRWVAALLMVLALVAAGVLLELLTLPRENWASFARGRNATWCLRMIPLLSVAPLLGCLFALRRAAPTRPVLAGAAAGLLSAGIGATLYALHCTDDSPLFLALWYSLAVAIVTAIGAVLGARFLRW